MRSNGRRLICTLAHPGWPIGKRGPDNPTIYGFHCINCRVWWVDSDEALCYVCDEPFRCETEPRRGGRPGEYHKLNSTCYHVNDIHVPLCIPCDRKVGDAIYSHRRRQLRRMAGLR